MNLYETVEKIKNLANAQPNVNLSYEGDVYRLNEWQDIAYAAVVVSQTEHSDTEDERSYGFNIFYVDRLLDDKSNKLEIQSAALEALSNIVTGLRDDFEIDTAIYHPFTERFDSECAGAYVSVSMTQPLEYCADDF